MEDEITEVLFLSPREIWRVLTAKLRGHYNYYGVSGNSRMIAKFGYVTIRAVQK
jgi:RNA-directed DNA polymerase